ncbi:hypothetical protein VU02_01120, partial [Desulfobulbus sp. N2]|nr:hypothetical protein [Desulfobulbus sp. N2]
KSPLDEMDICGGWSLAAHIGGLKTSLSKDIVGYKDHCGLCSDVIGNRRKPITATKEIKKGLRYVCTSREIERE